MIDWNALPWRFDLAASLFVLALALLAVPIATIALTRPSTTIVTAYAVGALGIVVLGGREGATINYLLDLSAALALALGGRAPRLATDSRFPIAAIVQLAVGVMLLNPFGVIPGRAVTTGAWTDPTQRISVLGRFGTTLLVEDSGLLVANGRNLRSTTCSCGLACARARSGAAFVPGRRSAHRCGDAPVASTR